MRKESEREVYLGGVDELPRLGDVGNNEDVPENAEHKHVVIDQEGGPQIRVETFKSRTEKALCAAIYDLWHSQTHSGEKTWHCQQSALWRKITEKKSLKIHMRKHTVCV